MNILPMPDNICSVCKGQGYTKKCATEFHTTKDKVYITDKLGSGCLTCGGIGVVDKDPEP